MFINSLIEQFKDNGCQGIFINNEFPNVCILLYADDISCVSDTVRRLQEQINQLSKFCDKWGMKVNLDKSKIIVFRNGGPLKTAERWTYNDVPLEVVSYYKYLGLIFTPKLVWTKATKTIADQAKKSIFMFQKARGFNFASVEVALKIFDKMITPVLLYGSEIWGFKLSPQIESVQIKFCKKLLMVGSNTSNDAVLGECGRYPLSVLYMTRCIKYWLKL